MIDIINCYVAVFWHLLIQTHKCGTHVLVPKASTNTASSRGEQPPNSAWFIVWGYGINAPTLKRSNTVVAEILSSCCLCEEGVCFTQKEVCKILLLMLCSFSSSLTPPAELQAAPPPPSSHKAFLMLLFLVFLSVSVSCSQSAATAHGRRHWPPTNNQPHWQTKRSRLYVQ